MKKGYFLVNFGGPRDLEEVKEFLQELLSDQDVVRSGLPKFLHQPLFRAIAARRSNRIRQEYSHIGGKSPIYEETEWLAQEMRNTLKGPLWTFHRYLPKTHYDFCKQIPLMNQLDEIYVFPLFPQMSYATTGSIARWFQNHLPGELWQKLRWVAGYSAHEGFIEAYRERVQETLDKLEWKPSETAILASFHGIPKSFVQGGDPYSVQCERSFHALKAFFPQAVWKMSYQSKFGPGEWLRPYTSDVCLEACWRENRKRVLVVPLAFTCDHIETLSEIENEYLPLFRQQGCEAFRVSSLNRSQTFLQAVLAILKEHEAKPDQTVANAFLVPSYCPFPKACWRLGLCGCAKN